LLNLSPPRRIEGGRILNNVPASSATATIQERLGELRFKVYGCSQTNNPGDHRIPGHD